MCKKLFLLIVLFIFVSQTFAEDWSMTDGKPWSREKDALKVATASSPDPDDRGIHIEHSGEKDWALSEGNRIAVKPGDIIELKAEMKSKGSGNASISVVTRTKNGDVVAWTYGSREIRGTKPWTTLRSKFMIPPGVETIEPRIVGTGPGTFRLDCFSLHKPGVNRPIYENSGKRFRYENEFLKIEAIPVGGTFSVTDKRTGRTWKNGDGIGNFIVSRFEENPIQFELINTETLFEYSVFVKPDPEKPEILIEVDGKGLMDGNVAYPPAFESKPGDRLIIPMNEGIGYPVEQTDIQVRQLIAYGGHGICMAFWGQVEDATGAGMMGILETPDDASIEIVPVKTDENGPEWLRVGAVWEPSVKTFGYSRKLRLVFFDKGGHVAVCKRYREHAKSIGLFKPFTEKVKTNPNIDILLGAANIWYWEKDKVELVREMKELGFDRILWSGGGTAEQIAKLSEIENVLTSRYDIYQDIMDPARFDEVSYVHGDWTTDAWPHDINWTDPDGTWRKGWTVETKDKTKPRIPCAVICDAKALPYARKRISKELETKPYKARFIDTTVAAPWFECYHPDHSMTRSDSRRHKMELLELVGELGLVCGSEKGHDASVPYCDYFEGMLSLGPYRVHESGRNMMQKVEDVPPQIENFQVNPALRLPLWELVYHDCTVAQWYWGDYNNKLPKVWKKRDLFNALYGTPPMYMFTRKEWNEQKDRFVESYRTATKVARATAYAEMVDHRILSEDRTVQQAVFSNGVYVTVNFGDKPFEYNEPFETRQKKTLGPLDLDLYRTTTGTWRFSY